MAKLAVIRRDLQCQKEHYQFVKSTKTLEDSVFIEKRLNRHFCPDDEEDEG